MTPPLRATGPTPRRLPRLIPPYAQESLFGYIYRLSHHNRYESVHAVLRRLGMAQGLSGARLNSDQIQRLHAISGTDPATLTAMQNQDTAGRSLVLGQPWRIGSLYVSATRLCPQCFAETGFHNRVFEIPFLTVCPKHRTRIINACPCGSRLGWRRKNFGLCARGHKLPFRKQPSDPAGGKLMVERLIFERCGVATFKGPTVQSMLHPDLRDKSLLGQLSLFKILGRGLHDFAHDGIRKLEYVEGEVSSILADGLEMALDWPHSLERWVNERSEPANKGRPGMSRSLQMLNSLVDAPSMGDLSDVVKAVVGKVVAENRINGQQAARWIYNQHVLKEIPSILAAASAMNAKLKAWNNSTAKAWVESARWRKARLYSFGGEVRSSVHQMRDEITWDAAARFLRIDKYTLEQLEDVGLANRLPAPIGAGKGVRKRWIVRKAELALLLDRISAVTSSESPENWVGIRDCRRQQRGIHAGLALKAIFLGLLPAGGWRADSSLLELKVDPDRLRSLFASKEWVQQVREAKLPRWHGSVQRKSGLNIKLAEASSIAVTSPK